MNISTSGQHATFLLGQQLPNGTNIFHDQYDHKMYSTNPLEVMFNTSYNNALIKFDQMVHDISLASNISPGGVKRLGLFKVDGDTITPISTTELNSNNTALWRTSQTFKATQLTDVTRIQVPVIEAVAEFESDGYLD